MSLHLKVAREINLKVKQLFFVKSRHIDRQNSKFSLDRYTNSNNNNKQTWLQLFINHSLKQTIQQKLYYCFLLKCVQKRSFTMILKWNIPTVRDSVECSVTKLCCSQNYWHFIPDLSSIYFYWRLHTMFTMMVATMRVHNGKTKNIVRKILKNASKNQFYDKLT